MAGSSSLTCILATPRQASSGCPSGRSGREPGGGAAFSAPRTGSPPSLPLHFPQALPGIQAPLTDADFSPQDWVFSWPHWGTRPLSRGRKGRNGLAPPCEHPLSRRQGAEQHSRQWHQRTWRGVRGVGPWTWGQRRAHRQCHNCPLDLGFIAETG